MTTISIDNTARNLAPKSQTFQERRNAAAKEYLALGWHLLKVDKEEKSPRYTGWPQLGITTEEGLNRLSPYDNLGILLGNRGSNLVDLEIDDELTDKPQGKQDLLDLFGGSLPVCPVISSYKGDHHLFKFPKEFLAAFDGIDGRPDGCAVFRYKGVECRIGCNKGAQTLLPPSIVNYDGKPFQRSWKVRPTADNIPHLPADVVSKLIEAYYNSKARAATQKQHKIRERKGDYDEQNWKRNFTGDFRTLDVPAFCAAHGLYCRKGNTAGYYDVTCPWAHEHSKGGKSLASFGHDHNGQLGFKCLHTNEVCSNMTYEDVLLLFGPEGIDPHCKETFGKDDPTRLTEAQKEHIAAMAYDYTPSPQHTPDGLLDGPPEVIDVQAHLTPEYLPVGTVADHKEPETTQAPETNKPTVTGACEAVKPKTKPNTWWHIGDILSDRPRQRQLIDRHLVMGEIAYINAESGVGKTYIAKSQALCVATGTKWLGKYDVYKGPVVYIGQEGKHGNTERVKAWCMAHNTTPQHGMFSMLVQDFDLRKEGQDVIDIINENITLPPVMIVLDTVFNMLGGGNENDGQEMGLFLNSVNRLKEQFGAAIVLCSHPGHENKMRMRGHSSQWPAAETVILCEGKIGSPDGVNITFGKQKNDEPLLPYSVHTVKVDNVAVDHHGRQISNLAVMSQGKYNAKGSKQKTKKENEDNNILCALLGLGINKTWQYSQATKICKCYDSKEGGRICTKDTLRRRVDSWIASGLITHNEDTGEHLLVRAKLPAEMLAAISV